MVIVGAGYTGLWTAYYLKKARPVPARSWCWSRSSPGSAPPAATAAGSPATWPARTSATPRRTGSPRPSGCSGRCTTPSTRSSPSAEKEGIDADIVKGGVVNVARTTAQAARLRSARSRPPAPGARPSRTCGWWSPAERAAGGRSRRRHLEPALRAHPAGQAGPGPGAGRTRPGGDDLRADARHARSPRTLARTPYGTVRARPCDPRHRGLHRPAAQGCGGSGCR